MISQCLGARAIRHAKSEKESLLGSSGAIYEELGAVDPAAQYIAVWLNMEGVSLLFVCKANNDAHFARCVAGDYLRDRAKFIINPVSMSLPFPKTHPRDGQTIGRYFGSGSSSVRIVTPSGAPVNVMRIDI